MDFYAGTSNFLELAVELRERASRTSARRVGDDSTRWRVALRAKELKFRGRVEI
jgi:hypothetical protein